MKCTNCGASLSDSAKFCPECGTKVVRELFCAECGTKLAAGTKFCPECGTKVGGSAASAPKAAKESYPKDNGSSKWLTIEDGVLVECDREAEGVVIIPEGVTEIGEDVFVGCEKITEIVIPASVETIDDSFNYHKSLRAFTVAGGNKEFKSVDGVLYSKDGKTLSSYPCGKEDESFTVPDGVTKIDSFGANESLVSVKLPDSLEKIGDSAFCDCEALESITLPDSLEEIGDSAFSGCKALESIKIPASVTEIVSNAFSWCEALCSIAVASGNEEYKSVDGVLYSKDGKTLLSYPSGKEDESFTVPDGVTKIDDSAFYDCNALESITLPASITKIGKYAFYECNALESIKLPDGVKEIGDSAFRGCEALESIKLPDGVKKIGDSAFYGCEALESITLPASITKIGEYALSCESLKQVRYEGTTDEWEEVEQGEGWLCETQVKKVRCSDGFGELSENAFGDDDEDEDEEPDTNDSEDDEIDTNDSEDDEIDTNDSEDWDEEEEEGDEAD